MEKISLILLLVAVICTVITVITEFTKDIGGLKKIPTSLQVLVTSIIVCELSVVTGTAFLKVQLVWYYPIAAFFAAFIIAIICTRGWDYIIDIFKRFYQGVGMDKKGGDGNKEEDNNG